MRRLLPRLLTLAAVLVLWSGPAVEAAEPEIVSGDVTIDPKGWTTAALFPEGTSTYRPATATVLVRNSTAKPARVKLWAWASADGQPISITQLEGPGVDLRSNMVRGTPRLEGRGEFTLPASSAVPIRVTFSELTRARGTEGFLAMGGPSVSAVSTVGLTIEQPTPPGYIWPPFLAGLVAAVLLVVARGATLRDPGHAHLPPIQQWTFKDGWASNVVVVGAVVTALIGILGDLGPGALGDFSVASFVTLNLVFGAMVLVAPLAYSALRKTVGKDEQHQKTVIAGSVGGLLVAAGAVLWATFGQLTSLIVVVLVAPGTRLVRSVLVALLVLTALIAAVYAWRTLGWLVAGFAEQEEEAVEAREDAAVKSAAAKELTARAEVNPKNQQLQMKAAEARAAAEAARRQADEAAARAPAKTAAELSDAATQAAPTVPSGAIPLL